MTNTLTTQIIDSFTKYLKYNHITESTQDLVKAIGKKSTEKLLSNSEKRSADIISAHENILPDDHGTHRTHTIELHDEHNSIPKEVRNHIENHAGKIAENDTVELNSGRKVPTSKFLSRSNAPKEIQDAHQNWARNKVAGSKIVISNHPGQVASCSTKTSWESCASPNNGEAWDKMPHDLAAGTLTAMHVHKDAKPNEDGEYDGKDILGRVLLKPHHNVANSKEVLFNRENRTYGKFPEHAKKAIDTHLENTQKHLPDSIYEKNKSVYNDDKTNFSTKIDNVDKALDNESLRMRKSAIENPKATAEHISKVLDNPEEHKEVKISAFKNKNITEDHISKVLDNPKEHKSVKEAALKHPKVTTEHISKVLSNSKEHLDVKREAMRSSSATEDHISKVLSDQKSSTLLKSTALNHPKINSDHLQKALDDSDSYIRDLAIRHNKINKEHISKVLEGNYQEGVKNKAIINENATKEQLHTALKSDNTEHKISAIYNKKLLPEHIDKALDDKDLDVRQAAIEHSNASPENINKALDDKDVKVRRAALHAENITKENLKKAAHDKDPFIKKMAMGKLMEMK